MALGVRGLLLGGFQNGEVALLFGKQLKVPFTDVYRYRVGNGIAQKANMLAFPNFIRIVIHVRFLPAG